MELLFQTIAPTLSIEVIRDSILQVLLSLMTDPIPNIRFNVAKSLEVIAQTLETLPEGPDVSQQRIVPAVESLKNDADADVRYFANRALQQALQAAAASEL